MLLSSLLPLVVVCLFSAAQTQAELPHKIDLDGNSYKFSAEITVNLKKGGKSTYELEEFHSAWQRKTRINYQVHQLAWSHLSSRTIYADDQQAFEVVLDTNGCVRIEHSAIDKVFQLDILNLFTNSTKKAVEVEDEMTHLVGVGRLLHYIGKNSDKFEHANEVHIGDSASYDSKPRYKAKMNDLTVSLIYGDDLLSLPLGLPKKVVFEKVGSQGFIMVIQVMRVVPLAPQKLVYSESSFSSAQNGLIGGLGDLPIFDVFAIDRGLDCSRNSKSENDFHALLTQMRFYRFSFDARVSSDKLGVTTRMFVGYDPDLASLRTDQLFESRTTQTLVSYRHDRMYHIIKRRRATGSQGQDFIFDQIFNAANMQNGRPDEDVSCVVAKVGISRKIMESCDNPHSLGQMLLGASKLTYLGHALVRGFEAHVFEAYDTQLPVWLEQPSVYAMKVEEEAAIDKDKVPEGKKSTSNFTSALSAAFADAASSDLHWRKGSLEGAKSLFTFTSVYYFGRSTTGNEQDNKILGDRLLLVEVLKRTKLGELVETLTIPIFDFTWDLQTLMQNGMRTEDFYSLGDDCVSPVTSDNHYARIDLRLTGPKSQALTKSPEWLQVQVKRNVALVRAIHEQYDVPSSFIYDLESRYRAEQISKQTRSSDVIAVTARAAERYEAPLELTFLGRGYLIEMHHKDFHVKFAITFQICYLTASHRHEDTLFAYQSLLNLCYIYRDSLPVDRKPIQDLLIMNDSGPVEAFSIKHRAERTLLHDDYVTKLDEMHARMTGVSYALLSNPSDMKEERQRISFTIDHLNVEHLNERIAYDLGDDHLSDVNKFQGLGLLPDDAQNKLIEPRWAQSEEDPEIATCQQMDMSFEQCQQACLVDLECRSFSTCIVDGAIQCILSSVDFKSSKTLVLKLMLRLKKRSRPGEIFPVTITQEQSSAGGTEAQETDTVIRIKKHPTCELHNKFYGGLFNDAGMTLVNLLVPTLYSVGHREQCAELCFRKTLETMRKDSYRSQNKEIKLENLKEKREAEHCEGYFYLDQQMVASKSIKIAPEQIVAAVSSKKSDSLVSGYCLLNDYSEAQVRRSNDTSGEGGRFWLNAELRQFELDFSFLYEKTYGVSLAETEKSLEEKKAYDSIYYQIGTTQEQLDLMRDFTRCGGNTGHSSHQSTPSACARSCFTQATPLWPACRSFELLELVTKSTGRTRTMCAFNTVTLGQVSALGKLDEMIRRGDEQTRVGVRGDEDLRVWHYEPREGLVASSLEQTYQVSLGQTEFALVRHLKSPGILRFSFMGLFLAVCVVSIVGLVAGAHLKSSNLSLDDLLSYAKFRPAGGDGSKTLAENTTKIKSFDNITRFPDLGEHGNSSERV